MDYETVPWINYNYRISIIEVKPLCKAGTTTTTTKSCSDFNNDEWQCTSKSGCSWTAPQSEDRCGAYHESEITENKLYGTPESEANKFCREGTPFIFNSNTNWDPKNFLGRNNNDVLWKCKKDGVVMSEFCTAKIVTPSTPQWVRQCTNGSTTTTSNTAGTCSGVPNIRGRCKLNDLANTVDADERSAINTTCTNRHTKESCQATSVIRGLMINNQLKLLPFWHFWDKYSENSISLNGIFSIDTFQSIHLGLQGVTSVILSAQVICKEYDGTTSKCIEWEAQENASSNLWWWKMRPEVSVTDACTREGLAGCYELQDSNSCRNEGCTRTPNTTITTPTIKCIDPATKQTLPDSACRLEEKPTIVANMCTTPNKPIINGQCGDLSAGNHILTQWGKPLNKNNYCKQGTVANLERIDNFRRSWTCEWENLGTNATCTTQGFDNTTDQCKWRVAETENKTNGTDTETTTILNGKQVGTKTLPACFEYKEDCDNAINGLGRNYTCEPRTPGQPIIPKPQDPAGDCGTDHGKTFTLPNHPSQLCKTGHDHDHLLSGSVFSRSCGAHTQCQATIAPTCRPFNQAIHGQTQLTITDGTFGVALSAPESKIADNIRYLTSNVVTLTGLTRSNHRLEITLKNLANPISQFIPYVDKQTNPTLFYGCISHQWKQPEVPVIFDQMWGFSVDCKVCDSDEYEGLIYRDANGITMKASQHAQAGRSYMRNGERYYVARDQSHIILLINSGIPANRIITTKITDMSGLFRNQGDFNQDLNTWDTSNVTTMASMFQNARSYNQPINHWDLSKVRDMSQMFSAAVNFNQPLNHWQINQVSNLSQMFVWANSFNQPLDQRTFTSHANGTNMLFNTPAFNQPLCNWRNFDRWRDTNNTFRPVGLTLDCTPISYGRERSADYAPSCQSDGKKYKTAQCIKTRGTERTIVEDTYCSATTKPTAGPAQATACCGGEYSYSPSGNQCVKRQLSNDYTSQCINGQKSKELSCVDTQGNPASRYACKDITKPEIPSTACCPQGFTHSGGKCVQRSATCTAITTTGTTLSCQATHLHPYREGTDEYYQEECRTLTTQSECNQHAVYQCEESANHNRFLAHDSMYDHNDRSIFTKWIHYLENHQGWITRIDRSSSSRSCWYSRRDATCNRQADTTTTNQRLCKDSEGNTVDSSLCAGLSKQECPALPTSGDKLPITPIQPPVTTTPPTTQNSSINMWYWSDAQWFAKTHITSQHTDREQLNKNGGIEVLMLKISSYGRKNIYSQGTRFYTDASLSTPAPNGVYEINRSAAHFEWSASSWLKSSNYCYVEIRNGEIQTDTHAKSLKCGSYTKLR